MARWPLKFARCHKFCSFFFWGLPLWIIIQELQCSKKRRVCTKNTWKSALYFYWNKPGKKRKLEYFTWKKIYFCKKVGQFREMIFQFEQLKLWFKILTNSPLLWSYSLLETFISFIHPDQYLTYSHLNHWKRLIDPLLWRELLLG